MNLTKREWHRSNDLTVVVELCGTWGIFPQKKNKDMSWTVYYASAKYTIVNCDRFCLLRFWTCLLPLPNELLPYLFTVFSYTHIYWYFLISNKLIVLIRLIFGIDMVTLVGLSFPVLWYDEVCHSNQNWFAHYRFITSRRQLNKKEID